jgi:extracellular elastinolytic metalloproteinase
MATSKSGGNESTAKAASKAIKPTNAPGKKSQKRTQARKTGSAAEEKALAAPAPFAAEAPSRNSGVAVPDDFHALYDRGFRASRGIVPPAAPQETPGHRQLARRVEDLDISYDQVTQLPNLVTSRQPAARLGRGAPATPESAVLDFVRNRSDLWNLSAADTGTIEVVSVSQPRSQAQADAAPARSSESSFNIGNLKTVNLVQRVDGKEVFNSDVTAAVNADNEVLTVSGQFFPGASQSGERIGARGDRAAVPETSSSEEEAIARAAFDLTNIVYEAGDFVLAADSQASSPASPYRLYEFNAAKRDTRPSFERPVRLKDVMFPLGDNQFVPGYYMELWITGYPAFSYVMDAIDTPDLLYRKNMTSHVAFKYRVHNTGDPIFRPEDGPAPGTPHPTGIPDDFQAKTILEKVVELESLLPGDPWLPPEATTTAGNNCIAYADLVSPDGFSAGDVMGKITSPQTFDQKYDHGKQARDPQNLQNSLVGMFFHVNWLHDRWYEAGFDEASGNAQSDNFGRGGIGGDPILAEGNDFSGTDNANMSTPADGASPRMQMFEFLGVRPLPSRTSNHEALITFHEMGHYITNRLVGNGNGLTNVQGRAMGEGWGDFFAICMTSQDGDDFAGGVFAAGGWTDVTETFKQNYYFSIRRYPYTADMSKNPLTFKHISNSVVLPTGPAINPNPFGNNEVHNAGEVWCAMLWEVFVNLVAKHGHSAAEKRMLGYVVGGLKLTPPRPTFTQARDGILSAVSAMSAGDLPEVRAGFAKRGMGSAAASPPSTSTSLAGVVESFTSSSADPTV